MQLLTETAKISQKINYYFERWIPITTPLSIALGFILPAFFINFRPFVPWLFGIMTFSGALKLKVTELGAAVKSPVPILLFFICAHILMPVMAFLLSSLFFIDPDVTAGFVLLFAGPTAVSGFIWVTILRGALALSLPLILLDTLLAPLVVPGSVSFLMGAKVAMDISGIAISLVFMIVIPTIIGVTLNETSKGKIPAGICPYLDPAAKICLMLVIAANASIVAPTVRFDDPLIWKVAAFVVVLTFLGFVLIKPVTVIGRCRYPKDISVIIAGGLRNNSAVMTIAVTFFPQAAVLPTLVSIIVQQSIMAIAGKLFAKKDIESNAKIPASIPNHPE
jgi:predicted Na+-dependent transporter